MMKTTTTLKCFHCDEPVACAEQFKIKINGKLEPMCCAGCQAVSQAIIDAGLINYYQYRTQSGQKQATLVPEAIKALSAYDLPEIQQDFVHKAQDISEISLTIEGITCAACAWLIEHKLSQISGILRISVNSTTHRALICYQDKNIKLSDILTTIAQIGYQAAPYQVEQQEISSKKTSHQFLIRLGLAGFAAMQVMMFALALYSGYFTDLEQEFRDYFRWVSLIFATPVVFYSAIPFYFSAVRSLLMGQVNMDLAVSIAICGAYIASCVATIAGTGEVYFESVTMFTFFLLLGRYFEQNALQKAAVSASNLHKLVPLTARKLHQGSVQEMPAKQLKLGDIIQVRAGETIAADGEVIKGHSSTNEAMLTGEQNPVEKTVGKTVFAGSINIEQTLEIKVTAIGQEQLLSKIIRLQEAASHCKPKIADTANKISGIFSAAILIIAAITYLVWHVIAPENAFWITLSVLVATCPCALALATPTAITCATAQLTKLGMIIRRNGVFDTLPKINHVVFDKTGTLTFGELTISSIDMADKEQAATLLNIIANLEQGSLHPIAKAFEPYFTHSVKILELKQHSGCGVQGHVIDKLTQKPQIYRFGHVDFACNQTNENLAVLDWVSEPEAPQKQYIWLSCNYIPVCRLCLTDNLRADAKTTISALQTMGIKVSIASGDRSGQVNALAHILGIKNTHSGMLPQDKLNYIKKLQQKYIVAMFGDGINDAPVLSATNLSIAMGSGTALAKSSADLILLGDQLHKFVQALKIAKASRRIIYQNLYWALGYNLLILPLAVTGHVYPYIAALGMSVSSLIVVGNSLRLLSKERIHT